MSLRGEAAPRTRQPAGPGAWSVTAPRGARLALWLDRLRGRLTAAGRDVRWGAVVLWWPLVALVAVAVRHRGERTALLPAFLMLLLLWPATLAGARLAGSKVGGVAGLICLSLFWLQACLPAPVPEQQLSYLARPLDEPGQSVRHVMRLPIGSADWRGLWSGARGAEAYLYVMVVTAPGTLDPGLLVRVNDLPLGELTAATWADNGTATTDTAITGWHRLPISRAVLEQADVLDVSIAPARPESFVPGSAGLVGGYSLRPTAPPAPSAFFDGRRWSTDPSTMLPEWPPSLRGAVRYYVELRVVQSRPRRLLAIYY